jgi:hypothetical protein
MSVSDHYQGSWIITMEERITPIWTTLWLVALLFSQPYMVVAVECFAGPISPMMVSLQERGRSVYCGDDLARDGAYNPVFGRGGVRPDLRASTELASPPFPSSPSGPRSSRKRTTIARRPAPTAASTALHSWRGGGGEVKGRMLLPVFQLLKLPAFVAQSKTRCFITLCASILGECVSTSLNKYSKVHGSPKALVAAMALYLMT